MNEFVLFMLITTLGYFLSERIAPSLSIDSTNRKTPDFCEKNNKFLEKITRKILSISLLLVAEKHQLIAYELPPAPYNKYFVN